jgi:ketol-acid reductoisomerase
MYMSEEMAYTYRKMALAGLVRQTLFHSQTSQYGAMSKGIRFLNLGLRERMEKIHSEIADGVFAAEWRSPLAHLKLRIIRFFAMRQRINRVEQKVRTTLGMKDLLPADVESEVNSLRDYPELSRIWEEFESGFDF